MRSSLVFLFLTFRLVNSFGQALSVSYSLTSKWNFWSDVNKTSATIITTSGSYTMASMTNLGTVTGTISIFGTPVSIQIADIGRNFSGPLAGNCFTTKTFNFSFSAYCSNYSVADQSVCNLISFSVTFSPVVSAPTTSVQPNSSICETDKLNITASSGYDPYVWQYSIQTGIWNTIPGFISSTASIGIQDIFGNGYATYSGHLNQDIYFRYTVGNCSSSSKYSSQIGPFRYMPVQVTATSSTQAPICQNGSDGSVTLLSYSRLPISGELFNYEIHTSQDTSPSSLVANTNLPAGSYYSLVTSNYGCGSLVFTSITVSPGPRKPLSASLSISSNYNGAQVSCNGSSDGKVTVSPNGGGNGSYMYSLDGGSYQTSNVFSGVAPGVHSVAVKDGCATPTTASTNSVTITAPPVVSISSITPSTCNSSSNGQVSITGSGGTMSYTYSNDGGSTFQPGNSFTGLATPGSYNVKIKDINNCQSITNSVSLPGPVIAGSVTPPSCLSTSVASLVISGASGGSGNLQWEIHDTATNTLVGVASSLANPISVSPGSFYAKVVDSSYPACSATTSNFSVSPPLSVSANQTSVISCHGQSTAVVTANPTGGTAPYASYSWSNGTSIVSNSQVASSLPAGTYSVVVTDSKGCQNPSSIVVTQPTQLTLGTVNLSNYNTYNISCASGSDGWINVFPSGGTPTYTYAWSTGAAMQNVSGLSAKKYHVDVKDGNGCQVSQDFTLDEPPPLSVNLYTVQDLTCFGYNNGKIVVAHSGGVGSISYSENSWASTQTDTIFSALPPASYTIQARDQNSCIANTSSIIINSPSQLVISSITKHDPLCNGDANGSLDIAASGGTPSYQFSNGGAFTSSTTFSGLTAGSYILSVRDGNSCTTSSPVQVLTDPAQLALSSSSVPQSCVANVDGSINLSGAGGTSPYAFSVDGGTSYQSNASFGGLTSGSYSTSIKDSHGCIATKFVGVSIQPALSASIAQSSPINCFGQTTGGLSLSVNGGTSPYNYAWSNGSTTQNINGLPAGNYSVTVMDSRNCSVLKSSIIDQPTLLSISSTSSTYSGYGVSCKKSTDGFINAMPSGGTSPYSFAWFNGATTSSISGLASGTYSVAVTDSKNCLANMSLTLVPPPALSLEIDSITNVTCNGGSDGAVTVFESGGVANYSYSIDSITWQASATFHSLNAASHVVHVRDGNKCESITYAKVTEPLPITINIGAIQDAGCNLANGSIQSSATGGTGGLNYMWKDVSNQTLSFSAKLTNAASGVYSLTVTDQSQCIASTKAAINNPDGPIFSVTNQSPISCSYTSDGQASVLVKTGPSPYTIRWDNGETGTSAVRLSAGVNNVTVTDGNNCNTIQNFITAAPLPLSLNSILSSPPSCPGGSDGSILVNATGGSAPLSYFWNGKPGAGLAPNLSPGIYSLTLVDANQCTYSRDISVKDIPPIIVNVLNQVSPLCANSADGSLLVQASGGNGSISYSWNDGTTSAQLDLVAAGSYTVTAADRKNCLQQKTIDLVAPQLVSESLKVSAVLCHGDNSGAINASASGGVGGYFFSKDNGNIWQSHNSFSGLTAGNYSIIAKDQNGCSVSSPAVITEPPVINILISKTDPTCGDANGYAEATVTGGSGSYKYQWSNSAGQLLVNSPSLRLASSDTYNVKVIDTNNCASSSRIELPPYPSAQFSLNNVNGISCSNLSDGAASAQVISAQSPYTLSWSNGETSTVARALRAGLNTITLTDANNCKVTKTFLVPAPLPIALTSETKINPPCNGGTGSVQVTASGGTGNLTYKWNGVIGTNGIQGKKAGDYDLIIEDNNGCTLSKKYVLNDPPVFVVNLGGDQTICPNSTASIGLSLPNATYEWTGPNNFFSTHGIVNVGMEGNYHLTVTSSNGCRASDDIVIFVSNNLLKADFLTPSTAHVGDTLVIVDISWPIPDHIEWQLSDGATVIHANNDFALITFPNPGDFKIGLIATQAGCHDEYYQIVSVDNLPRGGEAKHETGEPEVSSIVAYPNPFLGKTTTRIELTDVGAATLKVYSMLTNTLIITHEFQGDKIYNAEIDFNGREAGLYIVIVESGSKTRAIRIIKL